MNRHLDFIVIGAAKSGTTTLHEYLRTHPELCLPPAKEAPFFSEESIYQQGWDYWFERTFPKSLQGVVYGKITPHYMAGAPYSERVAEVNYGDTPPDEIIPRRIHDQCPEARLIAILRDPVARCISHHRMTSLLGLETRTLEQAIEQLLISEALDQARYAPTELNGYIVWGEYARILKPYYELFDSESIQIIFTPELDQHPDNVIRKILDFIGVDSTFVPPNIGHRYYEGAQKRRINWLDLSRLQESATHNPAARQMWHLLPSRLRRRTAIAFETAHYRIRMWNRVSKTTSDIVDPTLIEALREHFRADTNNLARLTGREVPWDLLPSDTSVASR